MNGEFYKNFAKKGNSMRLSWIDAIKGLAIIAVVFGHVEIRYYDSGLFPEQAFLLKAIGDFGHTFRMPLFFLLSGYLYELTWNERKNISWSKIKGKFCDIGILYLMFAVLYWITKFGTSVFSHNAVMVHKVTIWDLVLIPVKPFNYLWFLWVLTLLFLLVPCLHKLSFKRETIVSLFTVGYWFPWEVLINNEGMFSGLTQFFYGGFYFTLGSYLRYRHFESIGLKIKSWMLPLVLLICIGNSYAYLSGIGKEWTHTTHETIIALAASYIIWYVFIEYWDRNDWVGNRFFRLCGQKSLEIYLLHMYFVGALVNVFHRAGIGNLWLLIAMGTIIAVFIPLGVALLADRWKWVHNIFHPADWLRSRGLLRE